MGFEQEDEKEISISEVEKTSECLEALGERISNMQIINEEVLQEMFAEGEDGDHLGDLGSEYILGEEPDEEDDEGSDDIIDSALEELIDDVEGADYEEGSSIDAVYDAVASLEQEGTIEDMPTEISPDEEKAIWVRNSIPQIRQRLIDFGIEITLGAETVGGARY